MTGSTLRPIVIVLLGLVVPLVVLAAPVHAAVRPASLGEPRHVSISAAPGWTPILGYPAVVVQTPVGPARLAAVSVIHGTIVNASTGKPGGGLGIVLSGARPGATLTTTARAVSDARGRFTLKATLIPGAAYVVSATYRGVLYAAPVTTSKSQGKGIVSVTVYDTTRGDGDLLAVRVAAGVQRTGATLAVGEEWTLVDSDYRTAGAAPLTFHGVTHIPLPRGASQVHVRSIDPDLQAGVSGGSLAITGTVRPATGDNAVSYHAVFFTFNLPAPPGAAHPTLPIGSRYPVGRLYVFSLSDQIVAPGLTLSSFTSGGKTIKAYSKIGLNGGATIRVGVGGLPSALPAIEGVVAAGPNVHAVLPAAPAVSAAVPVLQPSTFPVVAVLIAAGVGFGLLLLLGLFGQSPLRVGPGHVSAPVTDRAQRDYARLVVAIAELDLRHEQGALPTPDYERRRAREKSRLLDLSRRLGR